MRKNHKILALLAVAMLLIVSVPSALSYFSTYTSAKGSRKLNIGNETEIYEKVEGNTKKIQITADKDSGDIYVRVKVFMPELSFLDTTQKPSGEKWLSIARFLQTYCRPIYALRKPGMCGIKRVVKIPKRFKKSGI